MPVRLWTNRTSRPLVEAALGHMPPHVAREFVLLDEGSDLTHADAVVVEIGGGLPAGFKSVTVPVLDLDTGDNERLDTTMENSYPPQWRSSYGGSMDKTSNEKSLARDLQEILEGFYDLTIDERRSLERLVFELREIMETNRSLSEPDRRNLELRTEQLGSELRVESPSRRIVLAIVSQIPGFITGLLTNATSAFLVGL